jgi:phage tail-like protein
MDAGGYIKAGGVMNSRTIDLAPFLPEMLWQESEAAEGFLRRFLHIFEDCLSTLDHEIDSVPTLFDPWRAPANYLPWLAGWLALELPEHWNECQRRRQIHHIFELYSKRGILNGLVRYLEIYRTVNLQNLTVEDPQDEKRPHGFQVSFDFGDFDHPRLVKIAREVQWIVDREKPAHSFYDLLIHNPTMQIGVHSTVGVDTILGTITNVTFNP